MGHLRIDTDKCVGCGKCVRICMKDNIVVESKKAKETGKGCMECSHCVSSCPKGAITLVSEKKNDDILSSIKSEPWFDGGMVSEEDIEKLATFMNGDHRCEVMVLEGEDLDGFMEDVWDAVKEKEADVPLVRDWSKWREENGKGVGPALWEGKQVLLIFADSPEDAFAASNRMKFKGLDMGVRGFHSNIVMAATRLDPSIVSRNCSEASKQLYMAYVIGHGRRLIEPVVKPIFEPLKGILGKFKL